MRKLVVWNLMSLDGYFEGEKPWDLAFHNCAWGPELEKLSEQFGEEGDLLVFGRKTYEGMAAYWPTAEEGGKVKNYMNNIAKIAVSKTIEDAAWNNTRVVSDPVAELNRLKAEDGKTIFIFGSAELVASLMKEGLVDEYRLCIAPVVLGSGNPLFKKTGHQAELKLLNSTAAANGAVILTYAVGKAA
ncbi:dihydrofolate reductase family protein [Neorhizobium sp. BETTINA12A]|uniref:dihydrofolate reductase family protein n=1 Tax=Neorhizobium sp. BETTINA12A TaxID=2908924 RepID=UPI001FF33E5B|nr:dihydrofolate reductase family protein [Neorhizobium sp. BETTINA12A]MCJ9753754.1 dihydrofolate reductase family protein [Neorhizobium sp. BETTINA12A]